MTDQVCYLQNISKQFNGINVLDNINLELYKGEIHAIIGNNGEGKSTLMSILAGIIPYDSGEIYINGKNTGAYNVGQAGKMGISYVRHDSLLVPEMNVVENIFLGNYPIDPVSKMLDHETAKREAEGILKTLNFTVDLNRRVNTLGVAEKRILELVKIICCQSDILILDEVASGLNEIEIKNFYHELLLLKEQGVSIFLVSQNLHKVAEISDRITMIYKGRVSWSIKNNHKQPEEIYKKMCISMNKLGYFKLPINAGIDVLRVNHLSNSTGLSDVSFTLHKGEILGLTGVAGSGKTALARCLFGMDSTRIGEIFVRGQRVTIKSPKDAIKLKIGLIEEIVDNNLVPNMTPVENITLANLNGIVSHKIMDLKLENSSAAYFLERLGFRKDSWGLPTKCLSFGEKQKVVLAKWLFSGVKILIMDEPTTGLDIGSKVSFYSLISELASKGMSFILVSTDIDELVGMCDKVFIIKNGILSREYKETSMTIDNIMRGMGE